jgi:hypothetical protein
LFSTVLTVLISITIIIGAIVIRRVLSRWLRERKLHSKKGFDLVLNRAKLVLNASSLPFDRLITDRMNYMEDVNNSCYKVLMPVLKKALYVNYGGVILSEDEVIDLKSLTDEAILTYYRKQKLIKRLKIKYIFNIL